MVLGGGRWDQGSDLDGMVGGNLRNGPREYLDKHKVRETEDGTPAL